MTQRQVPGLNTALYSIKLHVEKQIKEALYRIV